MVSIAEQSNDALEIFQIFVLKNRGNQFAGIFAAGINDTAIELPFSCDRCIRHSLPSAVLAVGCTPSLIPGSQVAVLGSEVFCDKFCGLLTSDAGEFDFDSKILILDYGKILLDFFALLGYNQGGWGKAPGAPRFGVGKRSSVEGGPLLFYSFMIRLTLSRSYSSVSHFSISSRIAFRRA